jgi:hypothetical protein
MRILQPNALKQVGFSPLKLQGEHDTLNTWRGWRGCLDDEEEQCVCVCVCVCVSAQCNTLLPETHTPNCVEVLTRIVSGTFSFYIRALGNGFTKHVDVDVFF